MTQNTTGDMPDEHEHEHEHEHEEDELVDGMLSVYPGDIDLMLQILLDSVHETEMEVGLTVTVGGTLISGILVSRRRMLQTIIDNYPSADEYVRPFLDYFESDESKAEEADASGRKYFVNLIRAQALTNGGLVPMDSKGTWRGRVSEIQGWTLGQMNRYSD